MQDLKAEICEIAEISRRTFRALLRLPRARGGAQARVVPPRQRAVARTAVGLAVAHRGRVADGCTERATWCVT